MFNEFDFDSLSRNPTSKNYSPLFSTHNSPFFVVNKGWLRPFFIIFVGNIFLIIAIVLLQRGCRADSSMKYYLLIGLMITVDFSYLLTQFLNPGISFPQQNDAPKIYGFNQSTKYCIDCDAYVEGYGHHCGWFQKCIGKNNKYPFFIFLFCNFAIFFTLMWTVFSCEVKQ